AGTAAHVIVQVTEGRLALQLNSAGAVSSQFALSALDIVPADGSPPPFDTDFNGTSAGAGWVSSSWDWAGGGPLSASVNGSVLTLAGGQMRSSQTLSNASVDGRVSFAGAPWQQF